MLFVNLLFIFPSCIDKSINNERQGDMTIEVCYFTFTQCTNNISSLVNYQPHISQLQLGMYHSTGLYVELSSVLKN